MGERLAWLIEDNERMVELVEWLVLRGEGENSAERCV